MMLCIHDEVGRITQTVSEPIDPAYVEALRDRGVRFATLEGERDSFAVISGCYVTDGAVLSRPEFPGTIDRTELKADGVDKATISKLPQPCILFVDGVAVERKAGTLTLTSDMPADYEIRADHWPFLPWTVTVIVR